jgi:hypothetical protein
MVENKKQPASYNTAKILGENKLYTWKTFIDLEAKLETLFTNSYTLSQNKSWSADSNHDLLASVFKCKKLSL